MKKLNSRYIGAALAVLFLAGLAASTVYSRGVAERQKPLVLIAAAESKSVVWSYETHGIVENASPPYSERFEYTFDLIIPEEAYSSYMSGFMLPTTWPVKIDMAGVGYITPGTIARVGDVRGDIRIVVGFNADFHVPFEGDEVGVLFELERELNNSMVPDSAVNRDPFTNEYYVFLVSRRDGLWSREYVVERQNVVFGLPAKIDNMVNVLSTGPSFSLPIVTWSDKPIFDGDVVRLFG